MSTTGTIAGHYCGQEQPHDAHVWQTPPAYGSTTMIFQYQCAGLVLAAPTPDEVRDAGMGSTVYPFTCERCGRSAAHPTEDHFRATELGR